MGRYKPTLVFQPQAFRKDARAKQAKAIINKSIPPLLVSDARARRGIESAELISDPPPNEGGAGSQSPSETTQFNISIHTVDTITAALRLQMNSPKATVGVLNGIPTSTRRRCFERRYIARRVPLCAYHIIPFVARILLPTP
ncbi:hypothetical protein LOZ65_002784 [Ophidiomyces ophidiicola]|nr:hypothetical protein LOZ65_002784 [Ophidiomyces ophidiicola]